MDASAARQAPTMRMYVGVWIGLLLIVAVEVLLAYAHLGTALTLGLLLALAVCEAVIGLLYFMHLRYEQPLMFWWIVPLLVFVFVMINHIWPDALRLNSLRLH